MTRGGKRQGSGRPKEGPDKKMACFRLSEECLSGLQQIAAENNLPQATVIYAAIRLLKEKLGQKTTV